MGPNEIAFAQDAGEAEYKNQFTDVSKPLAESPMKNCPLNWSIFHWLLNPYI